MAKHLNYFLVNSWLGSFVFSILKFFFDLFLQYWGLDLSDGAS